MKNDPTFKLLAAVILAGVIVAFANPSRPTAIEHPTEPEATVTAQTTPATE